MRSLEIRRAKGSVDRSTLVGVTGAGDEPHRFGLATKYRRNRLQESTLGQLRKTPECRKHDSVFRYVVIRTPPRSRFANFPVSHDAGRNEYRDVRAERALDLFGFDGFENRIQPAGAMFVRRIHEELCVRESHDLANSRDGVLRIGDIQYGVHRFALEEIHQPQCPLERALAARLDQT